MKFMKTSRLYIILLVCLAFDLYINFLKGQFVRDDLCYILANPGVHSLSNFTAFFTDIARGACSEFRTAVYRPLSVVSLALTYKAFGLDPLPYHFINVILHALNAVLVFYLCRCFPPLCKGRKGGVDPIYPPYPSLTKGGDNVDLKAFFIAAVFVAHPAQTEAVGMAASRANVQCLFFMLAAFLVYLRVPPLCKGRLGGVDLPPLTPPYKGGGLLYVASIALYILALFSKEEAVVFPFLMFVYLYFTTGDRGSGFVKHVVLKTLPFAALAVIFLIVRTLMLGRVSQMGIHGGGPLAHLCVIALGLREYLRITLFPKNLSIDYPFPHLSGDVIFQSGVVLCVILLIIYFAWRLRKVSPLYPLAVLWYFISLFPVMNIIPINGYVGERFLYLPMIGFGVILVQGVFDVFSLPLCKGELEGVDLPSLPLPLRRCSGQAYKGREVCSPLVIMFLIILLCIYSVRTVVRNADWKDTMHLWNAAYRLNPENKLAAYNIASEINDRGEMDKAIPYYLRSMGDYTILNMIARDAFAQLLSKKGRFDQAAAINDDTIRLYPNYAGPYISQGQVFADQGKLREAEIMFLTALKYEPDSYTANESLASIYDRAGLSSEAESYRKKMKELEPYVNQSPNQNQ